MEGSVEKLKVDTKKKVIISKQLSILKKSGLRTKQ